MITPNNLKSPIITLKPAKTNAGLTQYTTLKQKAIATVPMTTLGNFYRPNQNKFNT